MPPDPDSEDDNKPQNACDKWRDRFQALHQVLGFPLHQVRPVD